MMSTLFSVFFILYPLMQIQHELLKTTLKPYMKFEANKEFMENLSLQK